MSDPVPEPASIPLSPVVLGSLIVLSLLCLAFLALAVLLALRLREANKRSTEEDIRQMVDMGEEQGVIEKEEKELIENVFEFNNSTAEEVMVHRPDVIMLWVNDPHEEIMETIRSSGLTRFPVYDEDTDDVIGVLNTRDYLLAVAQGSPKPLRELLREAYFVPESVRTDVLFRDMQSRKIHFAVVVDEYGGTSGIITMEDLIEELVGNIYDEFDPQDEQKIVPLGDNLWRISGGAALDDVARALDMDFPDNEEAETLGGLVFTRLDVIPADGTHPVADIAGLHIVVEELSDRRVEWAKVSKLEPKDPDEEERAKT